MIKMAIVNVSSLPAHSGGDAAPSLSRDHAAIPARVLAILLIDLVSCSSRTAREAG
jgi:hypothetical protein